MRTLETGSEFPPWHLQSVAQFTAVAPYLGETAEICRYAREVGIDLSNLTFVNKPSEQYLPAVTQDGVLDVVLIDGKHTFPWPVIDWHYTADRLKIDGLMILDDIQLRPVAILCNFLKNDARRWRLERSLERTSIFRKIGSPIGDIAWHEQPWTVRWKRPFVERAKTLVQRAYANCAPAYLPHRFDGAPRVRIIVRRPIPSANLLYHCGNKDLTH